MGRTRISLYFSVLMLYLCVSATYVTIGNIVGCDEQLDCRRCTSPSEESEEGERMVIRCMKCRKLIVVGSRKCVDQCPVGYREEWSNLVNYMGRICTESSFLGLPVRLSAIVVGMVSGLAFCVFAFVGGFLYLRYRRRRASVKHSQCSSNSNFTCEDDFELAERREMLKHISTLRSEAPLFLAMLNDTRKQVRDLKLLSTSSDSTIQAFRPVLVDLARILLLLNSSEHQIGTSMSDWRSLFAWGERVLRRYKRQNPHQVAQAQLVSFLQGGVSVSPQVATLQPETLSTFQAADSSLDKMAASTFSSTSSSWQHVPDHHTILAEWPSNQDCFLDDDFITLGLRPQDEITTEL